MDGNSDSDFELPNHSLRRKNKTSDSVDADISTQVKEITSTAPRRVYLITYSKCDKELFPTRQSFGLACEEAFGGGKTVSFYACAEELHDDGDPHYHVTMKLTRPQRWGAAKKKLIEMGATVHFSEGPFNADGMYAWAYIYINKMDGNVYHSKSHPTLSVICSNSQRTKAATVGKALKRKAAVEGNSSKEADTPRPKQRMNNLVLSNYIRENNISSMEKLLADAEIRRRNGDTTLSAFILSKSMKNINEVLETTWKMTRAVTKIKNLETPRMVALRTASERPCVEGCNGEWLRAALEILESNEINRYVYAFNLRNLFSKGRGKDRNIFLMGPGNSGKTFLLKPIQDIYPETFLNPSASAFSWIGAEQSSIIMLNDYRWQTVKNRGNIEWGQLLNLLEGFECNLPAPMNHFSKHVQISTDNDVPIFATGPSMISWYSIHEGEPRGERHAEEDRQISYRWKVIQFTKKIDSPRDIIACPSCFAKLAFLGEN